MGSGRHIVKAFIECTPLDTCIPSNIERLVQSTATQHRPVTAVLASVAGVRPQPARRSVTQARSSVSTPRVAAIRSRYVTVVRYDADITR